MATWADVVAYAGQNYKINIDGENMIRLNFDTGDGRSQAVYVFRIISDTVGEWLHIESAIGHINSVSIPLALEASKNFVCGGISKVGDLVTLRHAVPLADLDIREFEIPLHLVTRSADGLEAMLVGADIA